jgi:hypothetical protein
LPEEPNRFSDDNREGFIALCVAENNLSYHLMQPKVAAAAADSIATDVSLSQYSDWTGCACAPSPKLSAAPTAPNVVGRADFKRVLADFMSARITCEPPNQAIAVGLAVVGAAPLCAYRVLPENLVCASGCGAILNMLALTLFERGSYQRILANVSRAWLWRTLPVQHFGFWYAVRRFSAVSSLRVPDAVSASANGQRRY